MTVATHRLADINLPAVHLKQNRTVDGYVTKHTFPADKFKKLFDWGYIRGVHVRLRKKH